MKCPDCSGTGTTRIGTVCICPAGEALLDEPAEEYDEVTAYELALEAADGDECKAARIANRWAGRRQRIRRVA